MAVTWFLGVSFSIPTHLSVLRRFRELGVNIMETNELRLRMGLLKRLHVG